MTKHLLALSTLLLCFSLQALTQQYTPDANPALAGHMNETSDSGNPEGVTS